MRAGLTLIETLAAVALIALAAAIIVPSLGTASDAAGDRAAFGIATDMDRRARLTARTLGPCELVIGSDRDALLIRLLEGQEVTAEAELPSGTELHFIDEVDGRDLGLVGFDGLGRSRSYRVLIRRRDHVTQLRVAGVTGWVQAVEGGQ